MQREGFVTYYPEFKELYPRGWGSWGWPSVSSSALAWVTVLRELGAEVGRPEHWGPPGEQIMRWRWMCRVLSGSSWDQNLGGRGRNRTGWKLTAWHTLEPFPKQGQRAQLL